MLIVPSLPEIMGALSKTSVFISHATEMGSGLNIGRLSSMEIWPGAPFSTRLITAAALRTATELLLENRLRPGEIERRVKFTSVPSLLLHIRDFSPCAEGESGPSVTTRSLDTRNFLTVNIGESDVIIWSLLEEMSGMVRSLLKFFC